MSTPSPHRPLTPFSLSRRAQVLLLAAGALLALGLFIAVPGIASLSVDHASSPGKPEAANGFRPTDAQWSGFAQTKVETVLFHSEEDTEGRIATNDDTTTPVFSQFSGRVVRVFAKAGDVVKPGDPLLAVQASEFVQGQNDLITAASAVTTAQAQARLAETAEKRQHALFDAKGGALKDWQQAQVDLSNAQGALRTAEISLAAVRNRLRILGKSDTGIAALETAASRAMVSEAIIPAPIGGTVIQRQVGVGQYINSASSGGGPVFSIGDLNTVWLVANVREENAPAMRLGQSAEVRIMAYPDKVFHARLAYIAPNIDPATRRLAVRAEVDNSDGALKPEMFARFRITTSDDNPAPAVPEAAVIREGETARVWVGQSDKTVVARLIRTGRTRDGAVEVLSGLAPGEMVISGGALFIDRAAKAP